MPQHTRYCVLLEIFDLCEDSRDELKKLAFQDCNQESSGIYTEDLPGIPHLRDDRADSTLHKDYRESQITLATIKMHYKGVYLQTSTENTLVGNGIVHLYRDDQRDAIEPTIVLPLNAAEQPSPSGLVLAILAIPSYMSSADLLGFLGDSLRNIAHLRLIRTNDLSRYIVLLKFRAPKDAIKFQEKFDGAMFNSIEPETVHCVPVAFLYFCGRLRPAPEFPLLTNQAQEGRRGVNKLTHKALPPIMKLTELPTCVVCLERMDAATTGLLTIACEHTFHCSCISKWVNAQATCPICRFSVARDGVVTTEMRCFIRNCTADRNLWMCLLCGTTNCGRYESQHAIKHFEETRHAFAMDLESGRIWDYSSDSYVHRLLQDKLEATHSNVNSKQNDSGKNSEDPTASEFEELLATQLESQRLFYEEQLSSVLAKAARAADNERQAKVIADGLTSQLQLSRDHLSVAHKTQASTEQTHDQLMKKSRVLSDLAKRTKEQFLEEQAMNKALMIKLSHMQKQLTTSQEKVSDLLSESIDLKEQINDLMLHFSTSEKIASLEPDELQGATIGIVNAKGKRRVPKAARA